MNYQHRSTKILITGSSGTGKTSYFLDYIGSLKSAVKFVFDHEGEFAQRMQIKPARLISELNESTSSGVAVWDPAWTFPGETQRAFDFFTDYAFTVSGKLPGKKIFAVDELQKLCGTGAREMSIEFSTLLETGRRHGLDFIAVSQSPNLIHTRVRNQLTSLVCFRLIDERAVRFAEECGLDPDRVRSLKPGSFIDRDLNSGKERTGKVF